MKSLCIRTIFLLFCTQQLFGQSEIDCSEFNFRVLEKPGATVLQKIILDQTTNQYRFSDLQIYPGRRLNAISFFIRSGSIYGFDLAEGLVLVEILPDHSLSEIKKVEVPQGLSFVAADIDQVNGIMYVLGYSQDEPEALLLRVYLGEPGFPVEYLPVFGELSPACADLVYQSATESLIGFDHKNQGLVEFGIYRNRVIAKMVMPSGIRISNGIPSLFFNRQSQLIGIGSDKILDNYQVYQFSLSDHKIDVTQILPFEDNQDACSCLHQLIFTNRVSVVENSSCNGIEFDLVLQNLRSNTLDMVSVSNWFPPGFEIITMESESFFETRKGGEGYDFFEIEFSSVPFAVVHLKVLVYATDFTTNDVFYNQAMAIINTDTLFSDDPRTLLMDDSTMFNLKPGVKTLREVNLVLCKGDTLDLDPEVPSNLTYEWSNMEREKQIRVNQPGLYILNAWNDCSDYQFIYHVEEQDIQVELGESRLVEENQMIQVIPLSPPDDPELRFLWSTHNSEISLCHTCPWQSTRASQDFNLLLKVITANGCSSTDEIQISTRPLSVFEPNAFTPNNDGINDYFQLYSDRDFLLKDFQVYNRWGELVYGNMQPDLAERIAWDGKSQGRLLDPGLYIWKAILIRQDGITQERKGEVNLIR